jgi:hypothetical protein
MGIVQSSLRLKLTAVELPTTDAAPLVGTAATLEVEPGRRYRLHTTAPVAVHDGPSDELDADDISAAHGDVVAFGTGQASFAARTSSPTRVWLVPMLEGER